MDARLDKGYAAALAVLAIGVPLMYVGGPDYYAPRIFQNLWNLGHIIVFFAFAALADGFLKRKYGISALARALVILVLAAVLGGGIELMQARIGRSAEWDDLRRDISGVLIYLTLRSQMAKVSKKQYRWALRILGITVLLAELRPTTEGLVDDWSLRQQYPVLSNLEEPFEKSRWASDNEISLDAGIVRRGRTSLKVELDTTKYSGVTIRHLYRDWRGASQLRMSVYNDGVSPLDLHIRVHDKEHIRGRQDYSDRFNAVRTLSPGWNDLRFDMEDIRNAPKTRKLNIGNIGGIGIFVMGLSEPRRIYIDEVKTYFMAGTS